MTGHDAPPPFRLAYVPGVTPAKWVRIWNERKPDVPLELVAVAAAEAPGLLRGHGADAGFVRLPVDRTDLSAIPLYTETTVIVIPKDHLLTAVEEASVDDLADEIVLHPLDDVLDWDGPPGRPALERPATTADAIELVAAGVGLLVVPQSLARLHHRRDLTYRPLPGTPESRVALSWPEDATTDLVDDFIGIVRGRTVNSTRGRAGAAAQQEQQKKDKRPSKNTPQKKPAPRGTTAGRGTTRRGTGGGKTTGRGKPRRRS